MNDCDNRVCPWMKGDLETVGVLNVSNLLRIIRIWLKRITFQNVSSKQNVSKALHIKL